MISFIFSTSIVVSIFFAFIGAITVFDWFTLNTNIALYFSIFYGWLFQ